MGAIGVELHAVFDAEVLGAEVEPALDHVHDDDVDIGHELEEFKASTPRMNADKHKKPVRILEREKMDEIYSDSAPENGAEGKAIEEEKTIDSVIESLDQEAPSSDSLETENVEIDTPASEPEGGVGVAPEETPPA